MIEMKLRGGKQGSSPSSATEGKPLLYAPLVAAAQADSNNNDDNNIHVDVTNNHNNKDTESSSFHSVVVNLTKCICGAGSFALPKVFWELGILGGTIAMMICGGVAATTCTLLATAKRRTNSTSYVELAQVSLGKGAARMVFGLTLAASLGVCSTYLVFIGSTLESMSYDATTTMEHVNFVRQHFPDVASFQWQMVLVILLVPLCWIRDYSIFAVTSTVGVIAVLGGIGVTILFGLFQDPGWQPAWQNVGNLPLWPSTHFATSVGHSVGTIAYLFCVNFLTFPIMNSMQDLNHYGRAVQMSMVGVLIVNIVFAVCCLAFFGAATQDLVLGNLSNGPYLSALKLFLCVDLLFTFPIVFSSARHILEDLLLSSSLAAAAAALLGNHATTSNSVPHPPVPHPHHTIGVATGGVLFCLGLAQVGQGGFGAVANFVGGVAQGTLAFVLPPAIGVAIRRRNPSAWWYVAAAGSSNGTSTTTASWAHTPMAMGLIGIFGVLIVSLVTYSTLCSIIAQKR